MPFRRPPAAQSKGEGDFFKWNLPLPGRGHLRFHREQLGEALLEGLVLASGGDWDKALLLEENIDYQIKHLEGYSPQEHRVRGGRFTYKSGWGAFIFIKLNQNL